MKEIERDREGVWGCAVLVNGRTIAFLLTITIVPREFKPAGFGLKSGSYQLHCVLMYTRGGDGAVKTVGGAQHRILLP